MRRIFKENGLSIVTFGLFAVFLIAQSVAGLLAHNHIQMIHGQEGLTWTKYMLSGEFWEVTGENWESEFLQMGLYVLLTAFLYQRGSAESKAPGDSGEKEEHEAEARHQKKPWAVKRGGLILRLYRHSLSLAFLALFIGAVLIHAAGGARQYSEELTENGYPTVVNMWQYMGTSRFWFESFQNWQSEFLAVFSIVVLSIFLREKGSPESKPVSMSNYENAS